MGCYDTVVFKCPKCGSLIEEQTKVGDCELARYTWKDVPSNIAINLSGEEIHCLECASSFTVSTQSIVILSLLPEQMDILPIATINLEGEDGVF